MLRPTLGLVRHRLQSRRRRHYPWIALASRKGGGGRGSKQIDGVQGGKTYHL